MFIVGDESQHHGKLPWVTIALVVINLMVFCVQQFLGERFTNGFSLVPLEITQFRDLTRPEKAKVKVPVGMYYDYETSQARTQYGDESFVINHYHGPFPIILTLLTSMFLHGDWVHLIGNMWFLAVFGRNVECALDHGRFLSFYLVCGVAGGLAHVFSSMSSVIPCLGASGAISGVMGAYVAIYPLNKIRIWLGWLVGSIELPAIVVVGFWFLFQYLSAFMELESGVHDGVAYWDHIGGFGMGLAIVWGTVIYLKFQQTEAPAEAAKTHTGPAPAAGPAASTAASGSATPAATTAESNYDPFADFLTLSRNKSAEKTAKGDSW
ncbi:MAG: rhomboid family intramembrane serine protease [Gemmataceae bacterium]|nr:rhomboid family intramembrane serine protease [Gemmataceae bacterium]